MLHDSLCLLRLRISRTIGTMAGSLVALALVTSSAPAQVLIGDPFITSYQNWVDPDPARGANWRLSLHNDTIMETANTTPAAPGAPDITTPDTGNYYPMLLVQDGFTTPANYDLNARMYTSDDDLWGLVFGYQDPNNYYRVGFRAQSPGNLGGTNGVSVQKVENGVISQITPAGPGTAYTAFPTFTTSDTRAPVDVKVSVMGNNYSVFVAGENGGSPLVTGSDPGLTGGKIGIQSWAQRNRAAVDPHWGTEVETISVTQGANTLYSGNFSGSPIQWRPLTMTNAGGVTTLTTGAGEDRGNFGVDINDKWIHQQTNGFENATFSNTDFIGPAIVVDEPGSAAFSNYQMQVRMGAADNDGYGLLVRVQDDNNFYRVNFANEAVDAAGVTRAPRGISVQKVRNGVWTELFRDDQNNPLFVPPVGTAGTNPNTGVPLFDVSVGAIGNSLKIQVRDESGNVTNYPLIIDNSDPILAGTVGLQTWGTDNVYYTNYGGEDGPLLTILAAFTEFDVTINRGTGNLTLTNNSAAPVNIRGISIGSDAGGLNPTLWTSVANTYDEPPGNGSVDPDDPWTIVASTATDLSEREESGGNGGTLGVGQSVNFGNVWIKSTIEDITVDLELAAGSFSAAAVAYSGVAYERSDLNTDGLVNANDWPLFYPNALADLSSLTDVAAALAGDLDGDGDNDVADFAIFKADFDAANGPGAFQAMIAGVPEPSTLAMLFLGVLGTLIFRRPRPSRMASTLVAVSTVFTLTGTGSAAPVDFTTFTSENFPAASGFALPEWVVTPSSASLPNNADATVLYSTDSALNKRYIGQLTPGTDDDVIGFVVGFEPGDAQIGSLADYLLIDWKGVTQNFQFSDGGIDFHHGQTDRAAGYDMPVGLALSRVTGSPTADEFWEHIDDDQNPTGGVAQLARGTTLGSTPYNRAGGSHLVDIRYTPTNVTVLVDGVEQFNQNGSFPDGRFGLYSAWQGPTATFSNFEVVDSSFVGLSATVDRSNGNITLSNPGGTPVEFDYYELTSDADSLNASGWNSLSDQNFQSSGAGNGQSWDEAGGSGPSAIGELYLQSSSSLAGGAMVDIGNAYNNSINAEDLVLNFRLPSGLLLQGAINYIGTPPVGISGDYDNSQQVAQGDLDLVLLNWGATSPPVPAGWINEQPVGLISQDELDGVLLNWGATAGAGSLAASAVPEPSSLVLVACLLFAAATCVVRQRSA